MSRILIFIACYILGAANADAAIRDGNAIARGTSSQQRVVSTKNISRSAASRQSVLRPARTTTNRNTVTTKTNTRAATSTRTSVTPRTTVTTTRSATPAIVSRAATDTNAMSETRTGAEYEKCKSAYFTCMDQFCQLKNDTYRRCSCNDRVYSLDEAFDTLTQAGTELTTFTENLDVVGMTAGQAASMRNASEGENALMSDKSASKALLQAIMNSIRGTDSSVGGKYSDLNSINISFDTANAFGTADAGQVIATYNGQNLYSAVYPQCRNAVRGDCNDASLQRAITAYLMAIEQDCNTVQTAIETKQKQMKSAVREGSAMLDLARVENRQKHNSSDFTTCLNDVESAILSEEVCGANYHKCLDNGEFIDITTGKPIAGVANFNELEKLLTFSNDVDAANQKLSKVVSNRQFVANFESRVKKFAEPALDKCVESADDVWAEYLDKALLDIYYAQRSKVSEIKQGCFDFISSCYANVDTGLTAAMKELLNGSDIIIQPDKIELNTRMCRDYIDSCNNMFQDSDIIAEYVDNRKDTDRTTACRAVAKQCFDKFGGTGYQNFYYPYSGLFTQGSALDWFTLYDYTTEPIQFDNQTGEITSPKVYKSECAKQLANIDSCKNNIESIFGGFDKFYASIAKNSDDGMTFDIMVSDDIKYGTKSGVVKENNDTEISQVLIKHHEPRPTGVATEIYYQIVDTLSTQCSNIQGRFMELQFILPLGAYDTTNVCLANFSGASKYDSLVDKYGIGTGENMCPRDYGISVDTKSWGACLCWENGARRSKWGKTPTCVAMLPTATSANDASCIGKEKQTATKDTPTNWCTGITTVMGQVCPIGANEGDKSHNYKCVDNSGTEVDPNIPEGITK
ncbi:MAG: hypothetical protein K2M34_01560 [Alphaproteobacteria bacterium]|nr:hypothetical protein [Alphaproteobacteria bacterium]